MFLAGEIFSGYPINYALGERKKEKRPVAVEVCTLLVSVFPSLFFTFDFLFSHLDSNAGELNPSLDAAII